MGITVKMENAATASLLAELTFRRIDGIRDIVMVTVSEGVGTGIFANGQLISGHRGMAGEFGHISLDPAGLLCSCGRRGCWETLASCRAALRYFKEQQPQSRTITFHELLNLAEDGNQFAARALDEQARCIGRGLQLIVAALSPSLILMASGGSTPKTEANPVSPRMPSRENPCSKCHFTVGPHKYPGCCFAPDNIFESKKILQISRRSSLASRSSSSSITMNARPGTHC